MPTSVGVQEKVLVIGSGIGGLSTGIILAKLGFDVTVIEKNRQPGGMMRSYARRGVKYYFRGVEDFIHIIQEAGFRLELVEPAAPGSEEIWFIPRPLSLAG